MNTARWNVRSRGPTIGWFNQHKCKQQMGSIRSEIFPTASKCVQLVHSFQPFSIKNASKTTKISNSQIWLWIQTRYLLVLLCPACQTLEKSILRKISLDHSIELQKNWRIRYNWYERYLISWHTRHSRAPNASNCTDMDLIWTWYGLYDIGFIKRASVISYLGSGSYQF